MKLTIDAKKDYLDNYIDYRDFKPNYKDTTELIITNYKETKYNFLSDNNTLIKISLPDTKVIGDGFLDNNKVISLIDLPKVEVINDHVLSDCENLEEINLPNVKFIGDSFLMFNKKVIKVSLPEVASIGDNFMSTNDKLVDFNAPKLKIVGDSFLEHADLKDLSLPSLQETGENFLSWNYSINKITLPKLTSIKDGFLSSNIAYNYYFSEEVSSTNIIDDDVVNSLIEKNSILFNLYLDIEAAQEKMKSIRKDFNKAFSNKHLFEFFVDDCQNLYNLLSNLLFNETIISHEITDVVQSYAETLTDDTKTSYLIYNKIYNINILDTPDDWTTILESTNDLYRLIDATRNPDASYLFEGAFHYLQNYLNKILNRFSTKYVYILQLISYITGHKYDENKLNRTKDEIIKCIWMSKYVYDELFVLISYKLEKIDIESVSISELISVEKSIYKKLRELDKKNFLGGQEVLIHNLDKKKLSEDDGELDYSSFYEAEYGFNVEEGRIYKFESEIGLDLNIPSRIDNIKVKEIGYNAFQKNHLNSVNLPRGLEIIARGAFYDNNLSSIVIPESVNEIGDNAFYSNKLKKVIILGDENRFNMNWKNIGFPTELVPGYYKYENVIYAGDGTVIDYERDYSSSETSINIPEKVNNIEIQRVGNNAFYYDDISSVNLPKTLKFIGNSAFSKNKLKNINLPDSIVHIGWAAFSDNQLSKVVLPPRLEIIDGHVFSSNKLKEIVIPESVTTIRRYAFFENLLTSIRIPNTVATLEEGVFKKNKITAFNLPNSIKEISDSLFEQNALKIVELKDGIKKIGKSAFQNNNIQNLVLPDCVKLIGEKAFDSNELIEVTIPMKLKDISSVFPNNKIQNIVIPENIENITGAFQNNNLSDISLPENLKSIGSYSFADNNISEINLPKRLVSIESSAFENNKINKVDLPDKLEMIGYSAFEGNNIEIITIPETVTEINYSAFRDNPIKHVVIKGNQSRFNEKWENIGFSSNLMPGFVTIDGFSIDNNGTILKYNVQRETNCPKCGMVLEYKDKDQYGVTAYGGGWCKKCINFTTKEIHPEIEIPEVINDVIITTIGERAFSKIRLKKLVLPNTLKVISDQAFEGNYGLSEITIPDGIVEIGSEAFRSCGIEKLILPNTLKKIGEKAFGFNNVQRIDLPKTLTEIESHTFYHNNLKSIILPSKIKIVGKNSFASNKISSLELNHNLVEIHEEAFKDNRITELIIPSSVKKIGQDAFANNRIKSIIVEGNKGRFDEDWDYIGFPSKQDLKKYNFDYNVGEQCPICGNELDEDPDGFNDGYCDVCKKQTKLSDRLCPRCNQRLTVAHYCNKCDEEMIVNSLICPDCGNEITGQGYCEVCDDFKNYFEDDSNEAESKTCPDCGKELDEDGWCDNCYEFFDE